MKIFEFRCEDCGNVFELADNEKEKSSCSSCGSGNIKRVFSRPILVKEQASYGAKTCCGRDERCDLPPCGESGECIR